MSEPRLTAAARLEIAVAGLVLAVCCLGLALLPLAASPVVRAVATAVHAERGTGLSLASTLDAAESVRRFVLDREAPPLPSTLEGREAFDDRAVAHLIDVREVILPARTLALALALLGAAWAGLRIRTPEGRRRLKAAVASATVVLGAGAMVALVVGAVDFDAFFTWFHGLFFADGTWLFPPDALLIQLFPLPFWVTMGALWAGLTIVIALLLRMAARPTRFTPAA